jgi:hypothetical protein
LIKYLSSKNLEDHTSEIIGIIDKHYKRRSTNPIKLIKSTSTPIKKRKKEMLFENQYFTIEKSYHDKEKKDIWVLKLKRKYYLGKGNFSELKELIECYDGYYSRFSRGFIFDSIPQEKVIEEITELIENLIN